MSQTFHPIVRQATERMRQRCQRTRAAVLQRIDLARPPALPEQLAQAGCGRELFAGMRRLACGAEQGAISFAPALALMEEGASC